MSALPVIIVAPGDASALALVVRRYGPLDHANIYMLGTPVAHPIAEPFSACTTETASFTVVPAVPGIDGGKHRVLLTHLNRHTLVVWWATSLNYTLDSEIAVVVVSSNPADAQAVTMLTMAGRDAIFFGVPPHDATRVGAMVAPPPAVAPSPMSRRIFFVDSAYTAGLREVFYATGSPMHLVLAHHGTGCFDVDGLYAGATMPYMCNVHRVPASGTVDDSIEQFVMASVGVVGAAVPRNGAKRTLPPPPGPETSPIALVGAPSLQRLVNLLRAAGYDVVHFSSALAPWPVRAPQPIAPPNVATPSVLGDWRRPLTQSLSDVRSLVPGEAAPAPPPNGLDAGVAELRPREAASAHNSHAEVSDDVYSKESAAVCAWFMRNVIGKRHRMPRTRHGLIKSIQCNYKVRTMDAMELAAALESLGIFFDAPADGDEQCIGWNVEKSED